VVVKNVTLIELNENILAFAERPLDDETSKHFSRNVLALRLGAKDPPASQVTIKPFGATEDLGTFSHTHSPCSISHRNDFG
jgi:hypothetical protein